MGVLGRGPAAGTDPAVRLLSLGGKGPGQASPRHAGLLSSSLPDRRPRVLLRPLGMGPRHPGTGSSGHRKALHPADSGCVASGEFVPDGGTWRGGRLWAGWTGRGQRQPGPGPAGAADSEQGRSCLRGAERASLQTVVQHPPPHPKADRVVCCRQSPRSLAERIQAPRPLLQGRLTAVPHSSSAPTARGRKMSRKQRAAPARWHPPAPRLCIPLDGPVGHRRVSPCHCRG